MIAALLLLNAALLAGILWAVLMRVPHRQFLHLQDPSAYETEEEWRESQWKAAQYLMRVPVVITLTEWIALSPTAQEDLFAAAVERSAWDRLDGIVDLHKPEEGIVAASDVVEVTEPGTQQKWMAAEALGEAKHEIAKRRAGL